MLVENEEEKKRRKGLCVKLNGYFMHQSSSQHKTEKVPSIPL